MTLGRRHNLSKLQSFIFLDIDGVSNNGGVLNRNNAPCLRGDNNNGRMRHLHTFTIMKTITKNVSAHAKRSEMGSLQDEFLQLSGKNKVESEPPSPPPTSSAGNQEG